MITVSKTISKYDKIAVEVLANELMITSMYSPSYPEVIVRLKYDNIKRLAREEERYWEDLIKDPARWFSFLYGVPRATPESLFTLHSRSRDLLIILLKEPIKIDKMLLQNALDVPQVRNYSVNFLAIDIEESRHHEFVRLVERRLAGGDP